MSQDIPSSELPIMEMLKKYLHDEKVSFHMPGHDGGLAFPKWFKDNFLKIDTTEFELTDDLNSPSEAFTLALKKASRAFNSAYTYFVTTGASTAIHACIYALSSPGDLIIADRNSHISFINACQMYKLKVIFAKTDNLEAQILLHPEACMVFVTRPDYYGYACNLTKIISASNSFGIPIVVDEAHGSHFAFAPDIMPRTALSLGADLVVNSAHKTLPALTQGAYLHLSKNFLLKYDFDVEYIRSALSCVSTTSPSFLISASLDYARAYMEYYGLKKSNTLYENILYFIQNLSPELQTCINSPSIDNDPFRLVITPYKAGLDIDKVISVLHESGIYEEFSSLTDIVFICKFTNTSEDFALLSQALKKALPSNCLAKNEKRVSLNKKIKRLTHMSEGIHFSFTDYSMKNSTGEDIKIIESIGRRASMACYLYPPGIPIILPGEVITSLVIETISSLLSIDFKLNGIIQDSKGEAYIKCIKL